MLTGATFTGGVSGTTLALSGDLDVDNINIDGNTISSTDSEGAVIIQPSFGGDINLDVTSNASYTEESTTLQGHILVNSTMNLGINDVQSPTTFYRRTYNTRPSSNQTLSSGQLVFQTFNGARSATTLDSAFIEAKQYYSSSGNSFGSLLISTNYHNGIQPIKLAQVEFTSEGPSNASERKAVFLGKVVVAGETTTGLQVNNGNIKVASGHGIDFSSDANASGMSSELFDDYEEGTFTPYYSNTSGAAVLSGAYDVQQGSYVKAGRLVHCSVNLALNFAQTKSITSGELCLSGMPFAPSVLVAFTVWPGEGNLLNWGSGLGPKIGRFRTSGNRATLFHLDSSRNYQVTNISQISTGASGNNPLRATFTYYTTS